MLRQQQQRQELIVAEAAKAAAEVAKQTEAARFADRQRMEVSEEKAARELEDAREAMRAQTERLAEAEAAQEQLQLKLGQTVERAEASVTALFCDFPYFMFLWFCSRFAF